MLPVAAVATAIAVVVTMEAASQLRDPDGFSLVLVHLERLSLILVPASFAAVAITHRVSRGQAAAVIVDVSCGTDVASALRATLDDPLLQVLYDVDGRLTDSEGAAATPLPGRLRLPLRDNEGAALAVVVVDPSLARHGELLQAALAAAALGITNARLRLLTLSQLAETQASRERIAHAGVEARQRLERDLHDGMQQRLLAVAASLSRARLTEGAASKEALEESAVGLRQAMAELRDLARGIHPVLLSQGGLALALRELTPGCGIPVRLDVSDRRWPAAVEATAYFVVCEALANATRHASATQVEVWIQQQNGRLLVRVTDNGTGGADENGHGLRGLADRVEALGGTFGVTGGPGVGTDVVASLPCG